METHNEKLNKKHPVTLTVSMVSLMLAVVLLGCAATFLYREYVPASVKSDGFSLPGIFRGEESSSSDQWDAALKKKAAWQALTPSERDAALAKKEAGEKLEESKRELSDFTQTGQAFLGFFKSFRNIKYAGSDPLWAIEAIAEDQLDIAGIYFFTDEGDELKAHDEAYLSRNIRWKNY
jgi:hypothetical protein